jgi:hypothetical protein
MPSGHDQEKDPSWESYYNKDSQPESKDAGQGDQPQPPVAPEERLTGDDSADEAPWQANQTKVNPHLAALMKTTRAAEKTLLDHLAVMQVAVRNLTDREKNLHSQPSKPAKCVESFERAAPCGMKCGPSDKDRVTVCDKCKLFVYNFGGMDQTEAEDLIFKQENRRGVTLYRRGDGRFLSNDCPVGAVQLKRKTMNAYVGGFALVAGLMAIVMLALRSETQVAQKAKTERPPHVIVMPKIAVQARKLQAAFRMAPPPSYTSYTPPAVPAYTPPVGAGAAAKQGFSMPVPQGYTLPPGATAIKPGFHMAPPPGYPDPTAQH